MAKKKAAKPKGKPRGRKPRELVALEEIKAILQRIDEHTLWFRTALREELDEKLNGTILARSVNDEPLRSASEVGGDGFICPYCESRHVAGLGPVEHGGAGCIKLKTVCHDCKKMWYRIYAMAGWEKAD